VFPVFLCRRGAATIRRAGAARSGTAGIIAERNM
jgi:hypothetical protein